MVLCVLSTSCKKKKYKRECCKGQLKIETVKYNKEILNSTGKVKEIVINKKTTQIDLSLFSSGVFIFKMTTKNNVSIQKIIVL